MGQLEGIWRWRKGDKPQRITKAGIELLRPVVMSDGKWIVAELWPDDRNKPHPLMRIRTSDGDTKQIDLPAKLSFETVAYVAEHAKILVKGIDLDQADDQHARFWLVDPASGAVKEVKGEFGPLLHQNIRPLQAALPRGEVKKHAGLYWAALPKTTPEPATSIGLYDAVNFKFSPIVTLRGLQFTSMGMWVREGSVEENAVKPSAATALVSINGDLIRIPLTGTGR